MKNSKITARGLFLLGCCWISACGPIQLPTQNQYQLNDYADLSAQDIKSSPYTLLVAPTEAVGDYLTNQMLYTQQDYQLSAFSKNIWSNPPAAMFFPILIQSLDSSHFFAAVVTSPYAGMTDYRLDTQIIDFKQNLIKTPSQFELKIKISLTQTASNQTVKSKIFKEIVPCPEDSPLGGVQAANIASLEMSRAIAEFIIATLKSPKHH